MGTRGDYLDDFLKNLNLPYYKGIFVADTVPLHLTKKSIFCIIINTDLVNMRGQHWLALVKYKTKTRIFDSLSIPVKRLYSPLKDLFSKLKAKPGRVEAIQPIYSNLCGFYCIHEILKFHLIF